MDFVWCKNSCNWKLKHPNSIWKEVWEVVEPTISSSCRPVVLVQLVPPKGNESNSSNISFTVSLETGLCLERKLTDEFIHKIFKKCKFLN